MVLLTMTPAISRALSKAAELSSDELSHLQRTSEPSLTDHAPGSPISHSQLIDLSKLLKRHLTKLESEGSDKEPVPYHLDHLLKGSTIYVPPPPPKKEPTPEYKALMARLRREEEARAYERMTNPPRAPETFAQRFPAPSISQLDPREEALADDDVTYEEVHRQIILIINVLVSIIACGVFIWVAARHWSAPKRLGLSMGGSGAIAIAEVIIYSGYVRRIREAKLLEKKKPEVKTIMESWVIEGTSGKKMTLASGSEEKVDDGIRHRNKKGKHR